MNWPCRHTSWLQRQTGSFFAAAGRPFRDWDRFCPRDIHRPRIQPWQKKAADSIWERGKDIFPRAPNWVLQLLLNRAQVNEGGHTNHRYNEFSHLIMSMVLSAETKKSLHIGRGRHTIAAPPVFTGSFSPNAQLAESTEGIYPFYVEVQYCLSTLCLLRISHQSSSHNFALKELGMILQPSYNYISYRMQFSDCNLCSTVLLINIQKSFPLICSAVTIQKPLH